MRSERPLLPTAAVEQALDELRGLIAARFPQATFAIEPGTDPEGVYLLATVDVSDTDVVTDVVGDRLVDLQVDDGLPVYVIPLRPIERVVAELHERENVGPRALVPTG